MGRFVNPDNSAFQVAWDIRVLPGCVCTERGDPAGTDSCDAEKTVERDVTFSAGIRIVARCNVG